MNVVGLIDEDNSADRRGALAWFQQSLIGDQARWILWSPVALGAGISGYFALLEEPNPWLGPALVIIFGLAAVVARRRMPPVILTVACLLSAIGFSTAQLRATWLNTPTLAEETRPLKLTGEVQWVERKDNGYRIVLDRIESTARPDGPWPQRVRLRVSNAAGVDLAPGQHVALRAVLRPPPEPAAPGAFDFARQAYFKGLGAVGYGLGGVQVLSGANRPLGPGASLLRAWELWWARLRVEISARVRTYLPGDTGGLAAALITGDRGGISVPALETMRDAGLAHLLAISGLHMGLVAGLIFLFVRAACALVPAVALYHPTKKWAAVVALLGAFCFLFLAGATIPTQRAFLMISVVLLAVLLDRRALSLRLVAWAAFLILLFRPESLVSASFQMSFAAVVALVAGYEALGRHVLVRTAEQGMAVRGLWYLLGVALTSVIAILATGPLAAYHFNQVAVFGLAANLTAVPLTAFWIMPWAIAAVCLMPLGLEGLALTPMGWGIDLVLAVAEAVASWPGGQLHLAALPPAFLALFALSGLWLCLWRGPWRYLALAGFAAAVLVAGLSRPPDIFISRDAKLMGFRGADSVLYLSTTRSNRFEADLWRRIAGVAEVQAWADAETELQSRLACDSLSCILAAKGQKVAFVTDPRALAEDCHLATVVVSAEPLRGQSCIGPLLVIDRFDIWREGAHAVWLDAENVRGESVLEGRGRRPWVRRRGD